MTDDWTISASKLAKLNRCGEEFRLRYMEGFEEKGPDSKFIRRGDAVHEAIEDALRAADDPALSSATLKEQYRANGGAEGYLLDDEMHAQVLQSLEAASRYLRKNVDTVRGIELEVEFGVDRPTITRDFGGYMDLATDGVVDWKTGKSEDKGFKEDVQGAVYMGGYAHEFGEPPAHVTFVYLNEEAGDDHPMVTTFEPSDDLWERLMGQARKLLVAVDEDEYGASPGPSKCHWCEMEPYCSVSPVGAGNIDWRDYPNP